MSTNSIEVGRILLRGFDRVRTKGRGCESAIRFPVLFNDSDAPEEAGFLHSAALNRDTVGGEHRSLIDFRRHHLGTDPVGQLDTAQRVPVLNCGDAKANGLAGFITPIGPVGGHSNLNGTDPVLG